MKQVKRIIERFVKNPDDGQLANLLLEQFHSGAPLELLLPLLLSPDEEIASSAAWIASELGPHGESLLDVVSVCFSLMSLYLFLALLFDFALECKRLSVGGFDVSLFSPIS